MVSGKVCELTDDFLWFVCGLYVGILMSPLKVIFRRVAFYFLKWSLFCISNSFAL